jgi:hypothetical protein
MTSPQLESSEQDYDLLLEHVLTLVEQWLQEYDDFVPCGAVITTEGEVSGIAVGADETTTVNSALEMLRATLQKRAKNGEIRASCVCYNGQFEDNGEVIPAIILILEHVLGPATVLRRPYQKGEDGIYLYAQMEGESGLPPEIFKD